MIRAKDLWCLTVWVVVSWMSADGRAGEPTIVDLWPAGLPAGAQKLSEADLAKAQAMVDPERIYLVQSPKLVIYRPDSSAINGCGIVLCPGGAYARLAWQKEGVEVAQFLNSKGITVGVLQYRVPRRDPDQPHREPLQDAQRAMRVLRAQSQQLQLDKDRLGMLGFSAGGHLTVMAGVHADEATYPATDAIDQQSCQPNFLCPIYAAYLGENYNDADQVELGSSVKITSKMPPCFLSVTADDAYRGVQAAALFIELKRASVPAELHIYTRGGHGYGIRPSGHPVDTWHHRLIDWLSDMGYTKG